MATYLAPGVYVEEIPPLARPIAGVGTSTAAFFGTVASGVTMPPGKTLAVADLPVLCTNFQDFKDNFGEFDVGNLRLALAVFGFFNNGGTTCWVVRVASVTGLTAALNATAPIDDISILAVPGLDDVPTKNALMQHCLSMEDRVAVLDGNNVTTLTDVAIHGAAITSPTPAENTYGAEYYPWLKLRNPLFPAVSGQLEYVDQPPSGHVAGVYARVDAKRGVFKAPANESIFGVVSVSDGRALTRAQQGNLNKLGINVIRQFGGSSLIYGARTVGGDFNGEFRYISTRRYMNFLKESIDEGTQFVVFEPNSPALWKRIIASVSDFLYNQWRDGALFGETPKQAFFVKCDAETNPPSVREAGQVITEIGVAIVKPAEFVIFRIQQQTGG